MLLNNDFVKGLSGLYVKPKLSTKDVIVRDESGRILYACFGLAGTLEAPMHVGPKFFSARDQDDALGQFYRRHQHIRFSLVIAAPAVGFFVHDNHGDKLSAGGHRQDSPVNV